MMKKILLSTAAVALAFTAMPAQAEIDLDVGGYFKGYGAFVDQDERTGAEVNSFDFLKDTELDVTGETVLENGLTVGFHSELEVDGDDSAAIDESYMYLSGTWGRVNFGEETGAAYLLQVEAPSADSNVDGLRTYIQPVNFNSLGNGAAAAFSVVPTGTELEYAQDPTGETTKLTYLTPVMNGFQAGVSFTPDSDGNSNDIEGVGFTDQANTIGATYEAAGRYEGQFDQVGFAFGAGYSHGDLEDNAGTAATRDDRQVWNVGLDLGFGPFGLGAIYKEDNAGIQGAGVEDEDTFVVGADYTTGPFKLGASYATFDNLEGTQDLDADRYTGGVVYTYGPGMTLRGSVQYVEFDRAAVDVDATSFLLGTQVNF
jgi:predicted porin